MSFEIADRLKKIPPYLFARIDKIKEEEKAKGKKLINLGIGDPDLPTPQFIIDALYEAAKKPENHQYPSYWGMKKFRKCVARWYQTRFDVSLDPQTEVLSLIGSKEGIAHIPLAFVNPGEGVLCPDPGYPVYAAATHLANGVPLFYSLKEGNSFYPDFEELEKIVRSHKNVKLMFLNYPNNPTAACGSVELFEKTATFAKKHNIIVCHDNAYSEIYYEGKKQPSFLEAPGAKDVGVEFHSVSKTFNMTGWRVGFCVGNSEIISGLAQVKTNVDSGIFNACQEAAIAALENPEPFCTELRTIYEKRRNILCDALSEIGLKCSRPDAAFYVWARLPDGQNSEDFVLRLIRETGIVATPGTGFGKNGNGYVRFTFCSDLDTLKQVAETLKKSL